jgi:hypothetical protein
MSKGTRPTLDELIDQASLLPPGPEAWAPIFKHYPELTVKDIAAAFRASAERAQKEADKLKAYLEKHWHDGGAA